MRTPFVFEMGIPYEKSFVTAAENKKIRLKVAKDWHWGPAVCSSDVENGNAPFYKSLANVWDTSEEDARNHCCMNCEEYHKIDPNTLAKANALPRDASDANAGPRVFCEKFGFVTHAAQVCQAWECEEEEDEEAPPSSKG
jgi:hypothetical protein